MRQRNDLSVTEPHHQKQIPLIFGKLLYRADLTAVYVHCTMPDRCCRNLK